MFRLLWWTVTGKPGDPTAASTLPRSGLLFQISACTGTSCAASCRSVSWSLSSLRQVQKITGSRFPTAIGVRWLRFQQATLRSLRISVRAIATREPTADDTRFSVLMNT
jgi:hypothetical protein